MLAELKTRLEVLIKGLDAATRVEIKTAIAEAQEAEAQLKPLIGTFQADLEVIIKDAEPELRTAAEGLVAKLVADIAALLGDA